MNIKIVCGNPAGAGLLFALATIGACGEMRRRRDITGCGGAMEGDRDEIAKLAAGHRSGGFDVPVITGGNVSVIWDGGSAVRILQDRHCSSHGVLNHVPSRALKAAGPHTAVFDPEKVTVNDLPATHGPDGLPGGDDLAMIEALAAFNASTRLEGRGVQLLALTGS